MTFNDDRRSEAPAAPHEFPQAWWTVLHATHGAPKDFQVQGPAAGTEYVAVEPAPAS